MFIFNLTYVKPIADVEKVLPAHRAYLDQNYEAKNFICSGRKNPRTGGIILCNCATLEEANHLKEQDPFYKEGIATYEMIEFIPSKAQEAFSAMIG